VSAVMRICGTFHLKLLPGSDPCLESGSKQQKKIA
jgi:hypothetical protein